MSDQQPLKQVLQNSSHLLLMQVFNYALPFLTFPYLTWTIGAQNLGQVHFSNAIVSFLVTLADFGLNITATQQVALCRDEPDKLHQIVGRVLQIRLLLIVLTGLLWFGSLALIPTLADDYWLHALTFLMVPAQVLAPTFFFQGQDKMAVYSRLTIAAKVLFTALVFSLVTSAADYRLVNPLNAIGSLLPALFGWYLLQRQLKGAWYPWLVRLDKALLRDSFFVSLAHLSQNALGAMYMVIAGFVLDKPTLGQFNLADKLIWPFRQLIAAGFQASYPQVVRQFAVSMATGRAFLLKLARVFGLIGLAALVGILVLAPYVIQLINKGEAAPMATYYLRLMAPLAFLIAVQVPFAQYMVATHLKSRYTALTMVAALLSYGLNVWLVQDYGVVGIIGAITAVEVFIVVGLLFWWGRPQNQLIGTQNQV